MSKVVQGGLAIVNFKSPPNEGRLVRLLEYKGEYDVPGYGNAKLWYIIPVSNEPLMTYKEAVGEGKSSKFLVPENWLLPITVNDPSLDMFLFQWNVDDQIFRSSESDFDS